MDITYSNKAKQPGGFALVATITIMVLIVLVALAMLALSTSTIRTQRQSNAQAEAQSNARLALMHALGELQKQLGPDQRISANGEIISHIPASNPKWTGAWDSWKAGDSDSDNPDGFSAHSTITGVSDQNLAPTYENGREDHFRSWLVSLNPSAASNMATLSQVLSGALREPAGDDTAVKLVADGSLGDGSDTNLHVAVPLLQKLSNSGAVQGRYGWWVGDESQKAKILSDSYGQIANLTNADHIHRSQAPGSMGNEVVPGLEDVVDETEFDKTPSLKSIDLVELGSAGAEIPSQLNFHSITNYSMGVLADVRESGLKRDLSTLLERDVNISETGDEFMLYRFDSDGEDRVPIQDLAAYYQLYENDPSRSSGRRGGLRHNAGAAGVVQVNVPDYGSNSSRDTFLREYTALYRNPVPIKVQFVLGVGAKEITQEERDYAVSRGVTLRETDKYKLILGVKPVVSLWNPNNVPMVMGTDASQIMKVSFPPFSLRWKKYRSEGSPTEYTSQYLNLNYSISNESTNDGRARSLGPYIMQLQFARNSSITFQPGEVKMFSIPINEANFLESGGSPIFGNRLLYQAEEFFPDGFYVTAKSSVRGGVDVPQLHAPNYSGIYLVFGDGDSIDMEVLPEAKSPRARAVSNANEVRGSAFHFWMSDSGYVNNQSAHFRNYQFISRFGGTDNPNASPNFEFNSQLMLSGFPDGQAIPYEGKTNALKGSEILAATAAGEAKALLNFFMMAGCETHESVSGGAGAGRRTTTRPFLHGSTLSAPQLTGNNRSDLYDYAWEWQVNRINELEEAFQDDGGSRGFYGGGYTTENGVTHVVQQYLPALPPISIASLSNARLGGFSLANAPVMSTGDTDVKVGSPYDFREPGADPDTIRNSPNQGDFRQVTATGQGGLAPHPLQAIGNSYAHPNVSSDKAFTTYTQLLNMDTDTLNPPERYYADHSYLANKALWDEYFFSSIAPQSSGIPLYSSSSDKSALEVANDFFFGDTLLPNRRLIPYTVNLSTDQFDELKSEYSTYSNGFADKIASHMMVSGPFNVNSTSVEAWKIFFSSLKGKPVAYLKDHASSVETTESENTPVAPGMLANGEPITSSELGVDSNVPADQWTRSRSLTDEEIAQLAEAMVKQVKLRGPFLSLSEFVNRRLDGSNIELSLKGALQAALDDQSVSINAAFRDDKRRLDGEIEGMAAEFPEALEGPIAYGSTPYVDQADILRGYAAQLTPRGDTFVLRAYGDSLDADGNVRARAWCEAVVQRTPDYVDAADSNELKQTELQSEANKRYGRKFEIIRFRWLSADEV